MDSEPCAVHHSDVRFAGAELPGDAEKDALGSRSVLYFDHNATSPLCDAARSAWLEATERFIGNPSSPHRLGSRADFAIETARAEMAALIGGQPSNLFWTSGATESNNTVLHYCSLLPGEAWVSAIEHPSVLEPARRYFRGRLLTIPVDSLGVVDLQWITDHLQTGARPAIIAVMAANNETGVLQPWRELISLCEEFSVTLLCDASQWIGKLPTDGMGRCTYLTGCAHKFGGPVGVGFLHASRALEPLLFGGPQEQGLRAGTENLAGIVATVAALKSRSNQVDEVFLQERTGLRGQVIERIQLRLPEVRVLGADDCLWNTISFVMPEIDCRQRWVVKVDKLGAAVSTGSACSSGKEKTSHVLDAMGLQASEAARVLRISAGWETTAADWDALIEILCAAAEELRASD
jgi:cysteine desulfurase